jgi:acid phosphatase type 7
MDMKQIFITKLIVFLIFATDVYALTDKYRLTLRDDPSTTIVIGWNQVSGSNPVVYFGSNDFGVDYNRYPSNKKPDRVVIQNGMSNHFVRLTGLKPNTAYYFVIRDSEGTSKRFWFRTAPDDPTARLSVIAGGDSRDSRATRQNANKLVSKLRSHVVLFGGDMTRSNWDHEWQDWFNDWQFTVGTDGRMTPIVVARGNHESSDAILVNHFDVPHENVYYALTFAKSLLRVYTLNSETSIAGAQTEWLADDLARSQHIAWRIAQYHRPMRPHVSTKSDGNVHYRAWSSLFYQHQVKLVIECDAHTVKSTWPVIPSTAEGSSEGFIRDDEAGTVFVGEGCWGAPLRKNDDPKPWTRDSGMFNQFNWIIVSSDRIETRFVRTDNADNVGVVNDADPFTPPANLDIWNPGNGSVIVIPAAQKDESEIHVTAKIAAGSDDAEERADGTIYIGSTDLELVYDNESTGTQTVGMRFSSVKIPKGATITRAFIQFTADENSASSVNLKIHGEATGDSRSFTTSRKNITARPRTSAFVPWVPVPWTIGFAGVDQQTPDLKNVVSEIISRDDWSAGNAIGIIVSGSGKRVASSVEKGATVAPVLHVWYKASGEEDSVDATTETYVVKSGYDDVEQRSDGSVYVGSTDLELTYDNGTTGNQIVGLRFQDVKIPHDARILSAYLLFTADETGNEPTSLRIQAVADDNAAEFSYKHNNVSSRTTSTTSTRWDPAPWNMRNESGPAQKSPDLKDLVQEVLSRPGWKTGNAVAFVITGNGKRTAWSYEGSPIHAPKLVITWEKRTIVTSYDWQPYAVLPVSSDENRIRVFPNPVTDRVTIQKQGHLNDTRYEYTFYNLSGEIIFHGSSTFNGAGMSELNIGELPAGMYVAQISTPTEKQSIKIVKQ